MSQKTFFTHREELWNAWTHAVGIVMGVAAATVFATVYAPQRTALDVLAVVLYLAGMLSCYVSSTLYHALPPGSRGKAVLRRFDHAAIFWHIAGSYAPLTIIGLRAAPCWGWGLFAFVWAAALAGTAVVFRKLSDHSHVETAAFVVMGLSVLVAIKPLADAVGMGVLAWVIAEGAAYVTGAVFYSIHRRRYMHTVFHFFVLLGSLCHIVAVWKLLETTTC